MTATNEVIHRFAKSLFEVSGVDDVLRRSAQALAGLSERGLVIHHDPPAEARWTAWPELDEDELRQATLALVDHVHKTGKPLVAEQRPSKRGPRTLAIAPLRHGDLVFGSLVLEQGAAKGKLTPEQLAGLQDLAILATKSLTWMHQLGSSIEQVEKLQLLHELVHLVSTSVKVDDLLGRVLKFCLQVSGAEVGAMLVGAALTPRICLDARGGEIPHVNVSRSILEQVRDSRRSVSIIDTAMDERIANQASIMAHNIKAVMAVPMLSGGRLIGAIFLTSQIATKAFTPRDLALIEALAGQAALAVQNVQLLEEREEQIQNLQSLLEKYEEAERRAVTDPLTGLYNRAFFQTQLAKRLSEFHRYGRTVSMLLLDIDHFKGFNDTYGHQVGDLVLKAVSEALKNEMRGCDIVARYGGEELAVVLPETTLDLAMKAAERLRARIAREELVDLEGKPIRRVTASIGVAEAGGPDKEPKSLIERTDQALYAAKREGRNRVHASPNENAGEGLPPGPFPSEAPAEA